MNKTWWLGLINLIVSLVTPIAIALVALRILLIPIWLHVEYRLPGFPEDTYGFTLEDRLKWATMAMDYLLNRQGIEFLSHYRFEDGSPLFTEREFMHMEDVKKLTQFALNTGAGILLGLGGIGGFAWRSGWWKLFQRSIRRGGWLTSGLIMILIGLIAFNFDRLFVIFHRVFFEGDSWLFSYSDTLIRLFPMRFWQDVFIAWGGLTLLGGVGISFWGKLGKK
jgi:integral membrane protein (TIGR01906 family)